jgi:hypothetical protein
MINVVVIKWPRIYEIDSLYGNNDDNNKKKKRERAIKEGKLARLLYKRNLLKQLDNSQKHVLRLMEHKQQ